MTSILPDYSDAGFWLAQQALTAALSAIAAASLDDPAVAYTIHGTAIPIQDVPEAGMMWTRVATVYPSDGSGQPFTAIRPAFEVPSWAWIVELGILFPRSNVDTDGYAIDAELETRIAVRDSDYRMAILDGSANYLPAAVAPRVLGQRMSAWTPIGPDGAITGGIVVLTFITSALCVPGVGP